MHNVLVYGTLRKKCSNHGILQVHSSEHLGDTKVRGTLFSLGPYPALSLKGTTDVVCEAYKVTDVCLDRLDRLEGHPNFYRREQIDSEFGPAFVYTMDHDPTVYQAPIINSGDWRNR